MSDESTTSDARPSNAAPLAPLPLPRMNPMAMELLDCLALLMAEVDSYRVIQNLPTYGPRREFTKVDMARGREMGPLAMVINESTVVVRLEN